MPQDDDLEQALRAVWALRRPSVFGRLATVEHALADALEGVLEEDTREEAERAAHQIAGSAGTFGFPQASVHARAIEHALRDGVPGPADLPRLATLAHELRTELEREAVVAADDDAEPAPDAPRAGPVDVLVVGGDAPRARRLADALVPHGLSSAVAADVAHARAALGRPGLSAVLLDLDLPDGRDAALHLLEEVADDLPVLVVDRSGDVDRDEVTHRSGHGPVAPELDVVDTARAVAELREQASLDGTPVAVVAPDRAVGEALRGGLAGLGVSASVSDGREDVRVVLARSHPELVVLASAPAGARDVLRDCRTIRNDPRWSTLPILVVPAGGAPNATAAFAAGADDHVDGPGPVASDAVAVRVQNRLGRVRALQARSAPAGTVAAAAVEPATAAAEPTVDVVLVEDDPAIVALLEHALDGRGLTVRHFGDGLAAAEALAGERPTVVGRVVLLDWDLPGIDGLRVLRAMAANGTLVHSRVIMLTARAGEREVLQALEAGASDHVAKPFSLPVLLQRVRGAMAR